MSKFLLGGLCLLMLSGCNDGKQQKLEECIADAVNKYEFVKKQMCAELSKTGVTVDCYAEDPSLRQQRLEAEDRCVKLYK